MVTLGIPMSALFQMNTFLNNLIEIRPGKYIWDLPFFAKLFKKVFGRFFIFRVNFTHSYRSRYIHKKRLCPASFDSFYHLIKNFPSKLLPIFEKFFLFPRPSWIIEIQSIILNLNASCLTIDDMVGTGTLVSCSLLPNNTNLGLGRLWNSDILRDKSEATNPDLPL